MKNTVAIIGAGPSGLIAADVLSKAGLSVTLYEAMPSVARKFLMAGRGGLNLTHSEERERFLSRYGASRAQLAPMIAAFSPDDLQRWCESLGQETFIGSSKRVFPKAMKASPLLRALLQRLDQQGVQLLTRHCFTGFAGEALCFQTPEGEKRICPDATLFALGGASWPRLGANGAWRAVFLKEGLEVKPFQPANCGLTVQWSQRMAPHFGKPLKNIAISALGGTFRGDAILSHYGLEGGPIYPLSNHIRASLAQGPETIFIDLCPNLSLESIISRLSKTRAKDSLSTRLRRALNLSPQAISLMREAETMPLVLQNLAELIKAVPVAVESLTGLERAISSAGGVAWDEVDETLQLISRPGTYLAGEMLDWEAPTGGYLLQGCFSSGVWAAQNMIKKLKP